MEKARQRMAAGQNGRSMKYQAAEPSPSDATIAQGFPRFTVKKPNVPRPSTSLDTDASSRTEGVLRQKTRVNLQNEQAL